MSGKFFVRSSFTAAQLTLPFMSFVVAVMFAMPLHADVYWNVLPPQTGDWMTPTNWLGKTLPTGTDTAYIVNNGTATVGFGGSCGTLSLGSSAGSGMIQMTAGSLSVGSYEYIGDSGTGSFTQSGGTNSSYYSPLFGLCLGNSLGGGGTYSLSGSGQLNAHGEVIGNSGTGSFVQTGGANMVYVPNANSPYALCLGFNPSGSGVYNQSGGSLSVGIV